MWRVISPSNLRAAIYLYFFKKTKKKGLKINRPHTPTFFYPPQAKSFPPPTVHPSFPPVEEKIHPMVAGNILFVTRGSPNKTHKMPFETAASKTLLRTERLRLLLIGFPPDWWGTKFMKIPPFTPLACKGTKTSL